MTSAFVSYSRKNKDFCKRLTGELVTRGYDLWVDWDDIPPSVDWMQEIQKGIEEADTFIAIITDEWISSKVCQNEYSLAVKNGKRLIPVVPFDINWDDVPTTIAQLNFIFFKEENDFNTQLEVLLTAINTDYSWLKVHSRLQVKANEWKRSNKENGFLLRGKDLEEAELQVSINSNKDPRPTDLQHEYVLISRQASTRQRRITTGILIGLVTGMLGIIGLLARPYVEDVIAKNKARKSATMIVVPAGSLNFQLLSDIFQLIEIPTFNINSHPVTNYEYDLCVNVGKCTPSVGTANLNESSKAEDPVVWITVVQAAAYCEWIGRRLPSAPEWEHAVGVFAKQELDGVLVLSSHYEWTTSYITDAVPDKLGKWDEDLTHLNIVDWYFLQEFGNASPGTPPELYSNPSGAFGANADLGFRCIKD